MKQINFTKHISPQERRSIHRWFYGSCATLITIIISLIVIYIHQTTVLNRLQKESQRLESSSTQLESVLLEKRALKEQEEALKHQVAKITRIKEKPKNPAQLLQLFLNSMTYGISLHSLQLKKKHLQIVLYGTKTNTVLEYLKQLNEHPLFKQIELQSIEPSDNHIKATLEAIMN